MENNDPFRNCVAMKVKRYKNILYARVCAQRRQMQQELESQSLMRYVNFNAIPARVSLRSLPHASAIPRFLDLAAYEIIARIFLPSSRLSKNENHSPSRFASDLDFNLFAKSRNGLNHFSPPPFPLNILIREVSGTVNRSAK